MQQSVICSFFTEMDPFCADDCPPELNDDLKKRRLGSDVGTPDAGIAEAAGLSGEEGSVLGGMDLWKKRRRVAAAPAGMDDGMTAYERQRAENIRRNNEILHSLGIDTAKAELERRGRGNAVSCAPPRVKVPAKPSLPVRRSARVRAREQGEVAESGSIREDPAVKVVAEVPSYDVRYTCGWSGSLPAKTVTEVPSYDESLVVRYTCGWTSSLPAEDSNVLGQKGSEADAGVESAADRHEGRGSDVFDQDIVGFQLAGRNLFDSALTRIYTMDTLFSGGEAILLAAAGHQGRISIYGTSIPTSVGVESCEDEVEPLLSWQGGAGWISHIQFLSTQHQEGATLVLSSSNDRRVALWDVNKQHQQLRGTLPRVVAETTELHSAGIFAMHEFQGQIATSSKDSSVSVAVLADGNFRQVRSMSGFHYGAVKGVRFRDSNIMASCGLNGTICLLDLRLREPCTKTLEASHLTSVNVVEWNIWQDNLLLSASNDPKLVIHDIRKSASHLHKLSGHVHPTLTRCKNIYRPAFVNHGKAVATPGERSNNLSLYSVATGNPISRGHIGCNPTMVMSTSRESRSEQLWVASKQISLFVPMLKEPI